MRKKLIALLGAAALLTGCTAPATQDAAPTPEASPSVPAATSKWDDMTFCEAFEAERENYQAVIDTDDPVVIDELSSYREWADALKTMADAGTAEDVAVFTGPLYLTEDATVNLVDVFMAGNSLGRYCISNP